MTNVCKCRHPLPSIYTPGSLTGQKNCNKEVCGPKTSTPKVTLRASSKRLFTAEDGVNNCDLSFDVLSAIAADVDDENENHDYDLDNNEDTENEDNFSDGCVVKI